MEKEKYEEIPEEEQDNPNWFDTSNQNNVSKEEALEALQFYILNSINYTNRYFFLPKHDDVIKHRVNGKAIEQYTFRGLLKIAYELEEKDS